MNHFTMAAPDVESAMHFWIDFMGGEWYSESDRLDQVLLGGILVDLFPPLDDAADPAPGADVQRFRFSIAADSIGGWVERAEEWLVRTRLESIEDLRRLTLVVEAPGGYHVGLEATFPTVDEVREAEARYRQRVQQLGAVAGSVR
jgi:hypothetical protein